MKMEHLTRFSAELQVEGWVSTPYTSLLTEAFVRVSAVQVQPESWVSALKKTLPMALMIRDSTQMLRLSSLGISS